jgi:hypothetical protein
MAKYRVTLTDGRTIEVYSDGGEALALKQAEHWDKDRFVMAIKRAENPGPIPCTGASIVKLKD